jgi:hypothetical protein
MSRLLSDSSLHSFYILEKYMKRILMALLASAFVVASAPAMAASPAPTMAAAKKPMAKKMVKKPMAKKAAKKPAAKM